MFVQPFGPATERMDLSVPGQLVLNRAFYSVVGQVMSAGPEDSGPYGFVASSELASNVLHRPTFIHFEGE